MSDPNGTYPPDEPVIGLSYPPPPPRAPEPPIGTPGQQAIGDDEEWADEAEEDDQLYADDEYDEAYDPYADDYGGPPARQPLFYVFLALALLVGVGVIVAILAYVRSGDDDDAQVQATATNTTGAVQFNVQIDSPLA